MKKANIFNGINGMYFNISSFGFIHVMQPKSKKHCAVLISMFRDMPNVVADSALIGALSNQFTPQSFRITAAARLNRDIINNGMYSFFVTTASAY